MYQGLPSTRLLRQLSYIIPYDDFYILPWTILNNFSWKNWKKKRAGAFFCSLLLLLPVIDCTWILLEYTGIYCFPLHLSSRLYFMDGWVFKRAFFENLISVSMIIKGTPSTLSLWIKLIKNPTMSACFKVLTIKKCLIISIRDKGRVDIIRKVMKRSYFKCQQPIKFGLMNGFPFPLTTPQCCEHACIR